ncbi:MAG: LysM peptidoglycan-binding domain-containing protein [Rhodobacteraceae bacterium]|nr:LysM peptidoglycan-binding domain-containing protein [Paracoccaceae bacterium]
MALLSGIKGQEKAVALALGGVAALVIAGLLTYFNLTSQPAEKATDTAGDTRHSRAETTVSDQTEGAIMLPGEPDPASPSADKRTAPAAAAPETAGSSETGVAAASSEPADKPEMPTLPDAALPVMPKFDLVRVDPKGAALVAGKADPGGKVGVYLDGAAIAEATADANGNFVAMFDMPAHSEAQVITLASRDRDGGETTSGEQVVVLAQEGAKTEAEAPLGNAVDAVEPANTGTEEAEPAPGAPTIIIASDEGARLLQPAGDTAPAVMSEVTLDLISYDDSGEVVLSGRGKPDRHVRVYIDDRPVKTRTVAEDGSWQLALPEVDAGRYRLRVDQIDDKGKVTSRLETPFQKEKPADVKQAVAAVDTKNALQKIEKVTIQRGATLWALAKGKYGEGRLYMQIFNANRSQIRDPDLIYPGQIFTLPD